MSLACGDTGYALVRTFRDRQDMAAEKISTINGMNFGQEKDRRRGNGCTWTARPGEKILVLAILALAAASTQAQPDGNADKILHFVASAGIAGGTSSYFGNRYSGMTAGMAAGIAKEEWDKRHGGEFDRKDLLADFAGCLVGSYLGAKFNLALSRDRVQITYRITMK